MIRVLLTSFLVLTITACASRSPVGTDYIGPSDRALEDCALYSDTPSASTYMFLRLMEAEELFWKEPYWVLQRVHGLTLEESRRNLAFALAELAYLTGKRNEDRDSFLLAAIAAYTYLEGDEERWGPYPSPYARRFRWACDLYNRALGRAFAGEKPGTMEMVGGARLLPVGFVDIALDLDGFPFKKEGLELLIANERSVRGLDYRVRDSGLGSPLIAVVQQAMEQTAIEVGKRDRMSVAATSFLRLDGDLTQLEDGIPVTLELHTTDERRFVEVDGRTIPLESDQSAMVAHGTELAGYWRHDLAGFFRGRDAARKNGLILPTPFQHGKIPVVLVHGTASSPTYWAEMLNLLGGDPVIRSSYQFWLFQYDSGAPIAYSAASLREELNTLLDERDPDRKDPALSQLILAGHSQGGLLIKMLGVTLHLDDILQTALGKKLNELDLNESQVALLERLYDLEPMPEVERMIFMSTPHRGSTLADSWFARTLTRMISVPSEMVSASEKIFSGDSEERLPRGMQRRVHTSLDNMNPKSNFIKMISGAPIDEGIALNSIIAIGDSRNLERATDGVVRYSSAHIDEAESEVLVPSGHSCQAHPRTLFEVRRILHMQIGIEAATVTDLTGDAESETTPNTKTDK